MTQRIRKLSWLCIALLLVLGLIGVAQASHDEQPPAQGTELRLLIVDGTKTFASTARVGALAGAIRSTGLYDLDVRFSDGTCLYDDPLACEADLPATPYDVVVVIPRGIDDASANSIWVVTTILPWTGSESWIAVAVLEDLINHVFVGLAAAVDPTTDLWPAFAASLYNTQGWLR